MSRFHYKKNINIPKNRQGYIHFLCLEYDNLDKHKQKKISDYIKTFGRYEKALQAYMIEGKLQIDVCSDHNISQRTFSRLVELFYLYFPRDI